MLTGGDMNCKHEEKCKRDGGCYGDCEHLSWQRRKVMGKLKRSAQSGGPRKSEVPKCPLDTNPCGKWGWCENCPHKLIRLEGWVDAGLISKARDYYDHYKTHLSDEGRDFAQALLQLVKEEG